MSGQSEVEPAALSVSDFCRSLGGIGRTLAYELFSSGDVHPIKVAGRTMVTVAERNRFLAECQAKSDRAAAIAEASGESVLSDAAAQAGRAS